MQQAFEDMFTFFSGALGSPGAAKHSSRPFLPSLDQLFNLSLPQAATAAPATPPNETPVVPAALKPLTSTAGPGVALQFPRNIARCDAWCSLLGIDRAAISHGPDFRQHLSSEKRLVASIDADIDRVWALIQHNCHINTRWSRLVAEITNVVLSRHGLRFYQGYMDIVASVVLMLGDGEDERVVFTVVEQLTVRQLRSQTSLSSDDCGMTCKRVYERIISHFDDGGALTRLLCDEQYNCACVLPAINFMDIWSQRSSADLDRLGVLLDLYLRSPPLMPLYVFAAMFMSRGRDLLRRMAEASAEEPEVVVLVFCKGLYRAAPTDDEIARAHAMLRELMEGLLAEEGAGGRLEDHGVFSLWLPHAKEGGRESREQGVTAPPPPAAAVRSTTALQQPSGCAVAPSDTTTEGTCQETSEGVMLASSSRAEVLEGAAAGPRGQEPVYDEEAAESIATSNTAVHGCAGLWRRLAASWAGVANWLATVAGKIASWWH